MKTTSFFLYTFLLTIFFLTGIFFHIIHTPLSLDLNERFKSSHGTGSVVYDMHNKPLLTFSISRSEYIHLANIPPHLLNAFIAAEDAHFWTHAGFSLKGILRSIFVNVYHRRSVQGASTITQQLTKLLFFDSRKTFKRKIQELFYSILIELQYTKHQILETYVNAVYFGAGVYGVEAAAKKFWQKSVHELTIDECALLAAIIKAPNRYCPLNNFASTTQDLLNRRNVVLLRMLQCNHIDTSTYQNSIKAPLCLNPEKNPDGHLYEYIRLLAEKYIGKHDIYTHGYAIYTTIDPLTQTHALKTFKSSIEDMRKKFKKPVDGGLLCIEGSTGAIRACVGGYSFTESQFNRAFYAKRQFGSIFKPIIYTGALLNGQSFLHTHVDEPLSMNIHQQIWNPQNYTRMYEGRMTLAYALARSNNIVAIKTLCATGIKNVIKLAKKFHVPEITNEYPSLALGCVDGTLFDATGMFNVFAQGGNYYQPYLITSIEDQHAQKIWTYQPIKEYIVSNAIIAQVNRVLQISCLNLQKKRQLFLKNTESIGKTGTTNESRTCWFCGATPTFTTSVYIGLDNNESLGKDIYPSNTVFPLWLAFNQSLEHTKNIFPIDPSLKEVEVDLKSGTIHSTPQQGTCRLLV